MDRQAHDDTSGAAAAPWRGRLQSVEARLLLFALLCAVPPVALMGYSERDPAVMVVLSTVVLLIAILATRPLVLGRLDRFFEADQQRLARSEAHYRLLFETSLDAVIATRQGGEIIAANAAAARVFGRSAEEMTRLRRADLVPTASPGLRRLRKKLRDAGHATSELTMTRPDGRRVELEVSSTHSLDQDGQRVTWTVLHDITEHKRVRREIEQLNRNLEARVDERTRELAIANEELKFFSSSVSHDLRAPVAIVRTFSDVLLGSSALAGDDLHHLERIKAAGDHMNELIVALLELAKLGRAQVEPKDVDLSALVLEVAQECRDATGRDVAVRVQPGGHAIGDPRLLRVAICNLLANAWKFTRDVARPAVDVAFATGADGLCTVTIRDNGAGFDQERSAAMFQPFQRLHSTREFPGLGIGLATVQRIVQRHGGRIWACGRVGEGATFHFTLARPMYNERSQHSP